MSCRFIAWKYTPYVRKFKAKLIHTREVIRERSVETMMKTKDRATPLWNAAKVKYWEFMRKAPNVIDVRRVYLSEIFQHMRIPKEVLNKYVATQLSNFDGTFREFIHTTT